MVAQHAAMTVAHHDLQEKLRRESAVKANLLRQFSAAYRVHGLKAGGREQSGASSAAGR